MFCFTILKTQQTWPFVIPFSDEFSEVMKKTVLHNKIPFDMNGGFVKLYFGKDKKRAISYGEFSQFLHVSTVFCVIIVAYVIVLVG